MRIITKQASQFADERGLDVGTVADYIGEVVTGYIGTLLWSEHCNGSAPYHVCDHQGKTGDDVIDCDNSLEYLNYGECDLSGEATDSIWKDVSDFVTGNWDDLYGDQRLNAGTVGHEFLLTRNRHGAGFWDMGLGERGDRLTANSHPYGETTAYVGDDELIYVS